MSENLDFDEIYGEFAPKISRYLARLIGDREAEDATQDVFFKVHQALPSFRGDSKLSTWIYRIATNTAYDRLRSSAREPAEVELSDEQETNASNSTDLPPEMDDTDPSLESQILKLQRSECYCSFIHSLPINYRTIVALTEIEGLSTGEIANILSLSIETVKIRLHRGRALLFKELSVHCRPEDWL